MKFAISHTPSKALQKFISAVGSEGRAMLYSGAAANLGADIKRHLHLYSADHHKSAEKLGASPTGHLEKAAQSVLHSSTSDSAAVSISSPGISRAFQSLTIVPKRARALTIPMHSVAYGKRASEVARSIPLHREGDALVGDVMGTRTVFYALKRRVTIPQERALLPTDEKLVESVERGIKNTIRLILANPEG